MMRFSGGANVNGDFKSKAKQHIKTGKKFLNKKVIPSAAKNYKNYKIGRASCRERV